MPNITIETLQQAHLSILIVDDNEPNRIVLNRQLIKLLGENNIKIDQACDGLEAVGMVEGKLLVNKNYDVIFMDEEMPTKNGTVAIREIKALEEKYAVPTSYIITNSTNEYYTAEKTGANASIKKPISKEDIIAELSKAKETVPSAKRKHVEDECEYNNENDFRLVKRTRNM